MDTVMLQRALGKRFFTKGDGKVYLTLPTGKLDEQGKPVYEDRVVSNSQIDADAALTATEYKKVDSVVTDIRNDPDRFTAWLRSLGVTDTFNGMDFMTYWYNRRTGKTSSRMTMNLEDDAPGTTIETTEDGVPLPLEFADWITSIRQDPAASMAAGFDVAAEKARAAAESVATGLDLRNINGWNGLTYKGVTVRGFRDVPTNLTVAQSGLAGSTGWLGTTTVTVTNIYNDIKRMVMLLDAAKVPGPFVLVLPKSFRHRLAETYSTTTNGDEKSLWMKILENPGNGVPNVLGISQIKLVEQMDEAKGGGSPANGEAYLLSLSPRYFRVLNYLPMQSFTIDLKGTIATKHRVAEGVCPLFKTDTNGNYGIVKLTAPVGE